jgi:hypothetical protein
MSKAIVPNLFVIGAAKCGTTALSRYLAAHPAIYMSEESGVKEPHFFDTDVVQSKRRFVTKDAYLALFDPAPPGMKYLGEATVDYLLSRIAVPNLLKMSPNAKLIVMVRNPVDMVRSMYNQNVKHNGETVLDLERAWRLQDLRRRGDKVPWGCLAPHRLYYGERASIGSQIERLVSIASWEQIHFIVYDDLVHKASSVCADTLAFLGLEKTAMPKFPTVNASVKFRLPRLQAFLSGVKGVRRRLGLPGGLGIHAAINRFNVKPDSTPISPAFRDELQVYFHGEVELLSELLNRDLVAEWMR